MAGMTKITMLLAQAPWAPNGDLNDQIDLLVQLNPQGHMDAAAYEADPESWVATRIRPGESPRPGRLMRVDGGWFVRGPKGDDEPLWDFTADILRPGEVVSLRQPDGTLLLFRIVAVDTV